MITINTKISILWRNKKVKNIILASNSPRRKELLTNAGINFEVEASDIDETFDKEKSIIENSLMVAKKKGKVVLKQHLDSTIISADTIVVFNNKVYGKPANLEESYKMIKELSNNTHEVITSVCIMDENKIDEFYVKTFVTFKDLTEKEINDYVNTKEGMDKAGAYGIQGIGKKLVLKYEGDYENIVGLPIKEVIEHLKNWQEN